MAQNQSVRPKILQKTAVDQFSSDSGNTLLRDLCYIRLHGYAALRNPLGR